MDLEERAVRPRGGARAGPGDAEAPGARLRREARALREALPAPCRVVALDARGKTMTSPQWSELLAAWRDEWPHPIAFVLGSDLGLDPEFLAAADLRLSFGPMTFPHELARLMLYEQLFRAVAIEAGSGYHRP